MHRIRKFASNSLDFTNLTKIEINFLWDTAESETANYLDFFTLWVGVGVVGVFHWLSFVCYHLETADSLHFDWKSQQLLDKNEKQWDARWV